MDEEARKPLLQIERYHRSEAHAREAADHPEPDAPYLRQ
jgi:hypothetical protein